jgi:ABC-type multidrug transport system ATPase subunit
MSEEILKALTQLFAIITKQDGGPTDTEREFVINFFKARLTAETVDEYVSLYNEFLIEKRKKRLDKEGNERKARVSTMTSMKDSVRTLAICKKINKTLAQKQKIIVVIQLLELINSDKNFSDQRREIINTVSEVFNIENEEYQFIEKFVLEELDFSSFVSPNFLVSSAKNPFENEGNFLESSDLDGTIIFIKIPSVDLFFVKYIGNDEVILNSLTIRNYHIHLYSNGSTIKPSKSSPYYYSDIVSHFNKSENILPLTFNAEDIVFTFPNGALGLRGINISEQNGKLIGIMGASGAGKTTLLNVLAGIETPSSGTVKINGIDIFQEKEKVKGVIGYISQDDILLEDLTVYENLYYNAKLCFKDSTEDEIIKKVDDTLSNLGLLHIKALKVGNVLKKKISGGQRKRLNIALELIREPAVMFVDEPTSGLSSRDSENVIDLLKELSLKGKIIFVVIHQPSSDIYKKFDKMFMMDTGGYPIFNGAPVEAVTHFKAASNQINSEKGQCSECGNVNPEQIFDIVEAKVVNEYGKLTDKRKVTPTEWRQVFEESSTYVKNPDVKEDPPNSLDIPNKIKQCLIYTTRDIKSKIGNTQYLIINLLEAPLLAALLGFIIRYTDSESESYVFMDNENIPAYILMSIVVALFMGLTVSAEEIIKDQKILKREQFLNLSRFSYLMSKIGILFTLSAVQTLMYVIVANVILDINGMIPTYWAVLFSISCFANLLGLNISASFSSAVTVYILIPLLLIPQMILSGAMFSFDNLNSAITNKSKTPIISDLMASRWAYEAVTVSQHKNNSYESPLYKYNQRKSELNFIKSYTIPKLKNIIQEELQTQDGKHITLIKNELIKLNIRYSKHFSVSTTFSQIDNVTFQAIDLNLKSLTKNLTKQYSKISDLIENKKIALDNKAKQSGTSLMLIKKGNLNGQLLDVVKNIGTKKRIIVYNDQLIQKYDPVYQKPIPNGILDYRAHLYSPEKHFMGYTFNTFYFNLIVIWIMSLLLFISLYFDLLKSTIDKSSKLFKSTK